MFIFSYKKRVFFSENESFIKKYVHTCNIYGMCTLLTMLKRIKFTNINISVQIQSTRI